PEVRLVHHVQSFAFVIQRQTRRIAIAKLALVEAVGPNESSVHRIDQPHSSGISLGNIEAVVTIKRDSEKNAAPVVLLPFRCLVPGSFKAFAAQAGPGTSEHRD